MIERASLQGPELRRVVASAMKLYAGRFELIFPISAVVLPIDIATAAAGFRDPAGALWMFMVLLQLAAGLLASAAIIIAVAETVNMRPISLWSAYAVAIDCLGTLWWATLRITFHVVLFAITIVGIPWAIQRAVRWVLVEQAVVLARRNAKDSLSHSAEVVSGNWWRTFSVAFTLWAIGFFPGLAVSVLLWNGPAWASIVLAPVIGALLFPLLPVGLTLLYLELREGNDITTQARGPDLAPA